MWEAKEVWGFGSWYQESIRFGSAIGCVWPRLDSSQSQCNVTDETKTQDGCVQGLEHSVSGKLRCYKYTTVRTRQEGRSIKRH